MTATLAGAAVSTSSVTPSHSTHPEAATSRAVNESLPLDACRDEAAVLVVGLARVLLVVTEE